MPFLFGITAKEKYICSNLKMDEYEEMLFENRLRNSVGSDVFVCILPFGLRSDKSRRAHAADRLYL